MPYVIVELPVQAFAYRRAAIPPKAARARAGWKKKLAAPAVAGLDVAALAAAVVAAAVLTTLLRVAEATVVPLEATGMPAEADATETGPGAETAGAEETAAAEVAGAAGAV